MDRNTIIILALILISGAAYFWGNNLAWVVFLGAAVVVWLLDEY